MEDSRGADNWFMLVDSRRSSLKFGSLKGILPPRSFSPRHTSIYFGPCREHMDSYVANYLTVIQLVISDRYRSPWDPPPDNPILLSPLALWATIYLSGAPCDSDSRGRETIDPAIFADLQVENDQIELVQLLGEAIAIDCDLFDVGPLVY